MSRGHNYNAVTPSIYHLPLDSVLKKFLKLKILSLLSKFIRRTTLKIGNKTKSLAR